MTIDQTKILVDMIQEAYPSNQIPSVRAFHRQIKDRELDDCIKAFDRWFDNAESGKFAPQIAYFKSSTKKPDKHIEEASRDIHLYIDIGHNLIHGENDLDYPSSDGKHPYAKYYYGENGEIMISYEEDGEVVRRRF